MIKASIKSSWSVSTQQIWVDLIAMAILFAVSVYVVYFTSQNIARIFFLLLLFLFLLSQKHYFWFAYFFVLNQGPGYLFADFSGVSQYRLPLYTYLAGMSLTPIDLFVILAFLKALLIGRKVKLGLDRPLLIILVYIVLTVVVTSVIYGTDVDTIAWNLRWLSYYSIIVSFLFLVQRKREIYRFVTLIFPFAFFIFFTQIFYVTTGTEFINLLNPGFRVLALNTVTGGLRPLVGGELIIFFSFVFSIFLIANDDYKSPKMHLYFVLVIAFLAIFLSATRLWFVIFSFILVGYIFVSKKSLLSATGVAATSLLVISLLMYSGLVPQSLLLGDSWVRLRQVLDIARGGVYSVDTAMNRLVYGVPRIMAVIKQNPLLGYGFSQISMAYYDNDFGFLNTILMFGVMGFSFFIFFFVKLFAFLVSSIGRTSINNPFKVPLKIMVVTWAGMLIGYFSTREFFTMGFGKVFFVAILIALVEFFARQADKEEILAN